MKNRLHTSHTESYRVIAGRSAHSAIRRTDGRLFHRGHIFCRADQDGSRITLGYSSGSKVWSANKGNITNMLDWCRALAQKLTTAGAVVHAPGLDILSVGEPLTALPDNVLAADWDSIVYEEPIECTYRAPERSITVPLTDTSIGVDRAHTTRDSLRVLIEHNDSSWAFDFTPSGQAFFAPVPDGSGVPEVRYGGDEMPLTEFLNEYPLHFYFADFGRLRGQEWFPCHEEPELFDRTQIQTWDWNGTSIDKEFWKPADERNDSLCVHDYVQKQLQRTDAQIIFYDHRTGEIADFLTVEDSPNSVRVTLYHCKGSGAPKPGARIGDVYEVAGQVVKSFNLVANEKELFRHIRHRANTGSTFLRGDLASLQTLIRDRGPKQLEYRMTVVQPGISREQLNADGASVLGAADEFVRSVGALPLVVIASS